MLRLCPSSSSSRRACSSIQELVEFENQWRWPTEIQIESQFDFFGSFRSIFDVVIHDALRHNFKWCSSTWKIRNQCCLPRHATHHRPPNPQDASRHKKSDHCTSETSEHWEPRYPFIAVGLPNSCGRFSCWIIDDLWLRFWPLPISSYIYNIK